MSDEPRYIYECHWMLRPSMERRCGYVSAHPGHCPYPHDEEVELTSIRVVEGDEEVWTIQICDCGFPLGAVLAAIKLKTCPDCGRPTIPVEDVTMRVEVRRS